MILGRQFLIVNCSRHEVFLLVKYRVCVWSSYWNVMRSDRLSCGLMIVNATLPYHSSSFFQTIDGFSMGG